MPHVSLSFSAASCAIPSPCPRPTTYMAVAGLSIGRAEVQSSASASSSLSGKLESAASMAGSPVHEASRSSVAARLGMKDLALGARAQPQGLEAQVLVAVPPCPAVAAPVGVQPLF